MLLIFSFPNFNQPWCAWIALVPWLLLLPGLKPREAFWWSYAIGCIFFLGSIWWLIYVTVFGWLLLCAYLALFFGAFGLAAHLAYARYAKRYTLILIVVPAIWVALEYVRSHFLSGFGWNLLGYSQASWPAVIQAASLTGVWGISWIVAAFNAALAVLANPRVFWRRRLAAGLICAAIASGAVGYGSFRLSQPFTDIRPAVRVAVVQGSIPQERKWDESYAEGILSRYERLTRQAAQTKPGLVIWPETSAPGYVGVDEDLTQRIFSLGKEVQRPLLIGSPVPKLVDGSFVFLNRANLVDADAIVATYDKLHLVPYGEFIPGDRQFPWLRKLFPPIGDFVPGKEYTVFNLGSGPGAQGSGQSIDPQPPAPSPTPLKFSVLICFEDVFPELARAFVRRGAQALVVITNDAWFGPTAAAYQHAQASALRAVELARPVVRAANTGWSGCIDAWGRMGNFVHQDNGQALFIEGLAECEVVPVTGQTLYSLLGDWFAWICLAVTLTGIVPGIITGLNPRRNTGGT